MDTFLRRKVRTCLLTFLFCVVALQEDRLSCIK